MPWYNNKTFNRPVFLSAAKLLPVKKLKSSLPWLTVIRGKNGINIMNSVILTQKPLSDARNTIIEKGLMNYIKDNPGKTVQHYEDARKTLRSTLLNKQRKYLNQSSSMALGATGNTKKGPKAYVHLDAIKNVNRTEPAMTFRNVAHHEKFHLLPYIGASEALAHAYGGFNAKRNAPLFTNLANSGRLLNLFIKQHPKRALKEFGLAAGGLAGTYGAGKGLSYLYNNSLEGDDNAES